MTTDYAPQYTATNGSPPPSPSPASPAAPPNPPAAGPRAPHLEDWVEVPEYPGYRARCWLNFPQRLLNEVASGDQATAAAALGRIVSEHNGWCDEDGVPYPAAGDPAFWQAIPTHLATRVIGALMTRVTQNPFAPPTRPR